MNNKEIEQKIEELLSEVNRPVKVDSPLFSQIAFDYSELVSKCGRLWSKCKANFEGQKVEFEIWESLTQIQVRQDLENQTLAKKEFNKDSKSERITESRIQAEIKLDKEYRQKKQDLIDAECLFHLCEKALYDAAKLRGFVSQAIVKQKRNE